MKINLSPKQNLVLWQLLITGDEPAISKVKPELSVQERNELVDHGLIELVKRKQSRHIVLTDKAWAWASEQSVPAFSRSPDPALLLTLLHKVQAYLRANDISLAEFLAPSEAAASEPTPTKETPTDNGTLSVVTATLKEQIQSAYAKITQGQWNVRVRLADLRKHLAHSSQEAIDAALRQMQLDGQSVLMPLDDPKGIGAEDEEAAVNIGGDRRHIVYLKGFIGKGDA